jgi:hypothetical protein
MIKDLCFISGVYSHIWLNVPKDDFLSIINDFFLSFCCLFLSLFPKHEEQICNDFTFFCYQMIFFCLTT